MNIAIIVAMARNHVIGANGRMPWHLPAELGYFRSVTWGKPIVMGRSTFEAIGRALPGRQNIVLSRQADFVAPGCEVVHQLDEAWRIAQGDEIMVIGGAALYTQTLSLATRLYLTEIDANVTGDTYFPTFDRQHWQETARVEHAADAKNPYNYACLTLRRC